MHHNFIAMYRVMCFETFFLIANTVNTASVKFKSRIVVYILKFLFNLTFIPKVYQ